METTLGPPHRPADLVPGHESSKTITFAPALGSSGSADLASIWMISFVKKILLLPGHKKIDICVQTPNQPMLSNECDCSIIKCKSSEKLFLWFKVAASFRFKCWQNKLPQQRITECCKKMQLVRLLWMNQFPCLSASFTLYGWFRFSQKAKQRDVCN